MKNAPLYLIVLLLTLGSFPAAFGQELPTGQSDRPDGDARMVRHWSVFSDLPSDSITALYEDDDGYLWVGTFDSVLRFDGHSFNAYDSRHAPGLGIHSASVFLESDKRLWVGSVNEGLAVFRDDGYTTYTQSDGLLSDSVLSLAYDSAGTLWIGTNQGLQRGPGHDFALPDYQAPDPFARQGVTRLLFHDEWGLVAAAQRRGVYLFAGSNPTLVAGSEDVIVSDMVLWKDGRVVLGTRDGAVFEVTTEGLKELSSLHVPEGPVRDLHYNPVADRLWIASDSSLRYQGPDGVHEYLHGPEDVFIHTLKTVIEDSDGSLWLGTRSGGLFAVSPSRFTNRVSIQGGGDPAVNSVTVESDGRLWVASDDGLHCFEEDVAVENRLTELLDGVRVKHVLAHNGDLYVSTISAYGLVYANGDEIQFLNEDGGMPSNVIKMSLIDSQGVLWISTSKGLVRHDEGRLTVYNRESGFLADEIYQISEDSDGLIWVTTVGHGLVSLDRNGIYRRYGPEEGLAGNMVFSCYEDLHGNYWVSTTEGVFLLDRDGRIYPLDYSRGLPYLYAYNAYPTGDTLVITSVTGVATTTIDQAALAAQGEIPAAPMTEWGIAHGLSGSPNALSWPTSHENGLWIPTHHGADFFPINWDKPDSPDAAVHLDSVIVDGRPHPGGTELFRTEDRVNRLAFGYSYPSLARAGGLVFSSRLVGYQDEWYEPTSDRSIAYTNVGSGTYRFEVRVGRVSGRVTPETQVQWSAPASFPLEIRRTFTVPSAILIVVALTSLCSAVLVVYVILRRARGARRTGRETSPDLSSLDSVKVMQEEYSLTNRETELVNMLSRGLRDKEIADELGCAVSTVSNSFSRLYRKTGTKGRAELVAILHR